MPVNKDILFTEIRKINDQDFEEFEGFPETTEEASLRWCAAFNEYASTVTPPSSPIGIELAQQACESVLFASLSASNPTSLETAFQAYVVELGNGMQPAFTAVPPVGVVLAPVFVIGLAGGSAEAVAETMSGIIDAWFRTGTATNNSSGVTVPWS